MSQWNIAVATVLGASLGTWLLLRKAQREGTPLDGGCAAPRAQERPTAQRGAVAGMTEETQS